MMTHRIQSNSQTEDKTDSSNVVMSTNQFRLLLNAFQTSQTSFTQQFVAQLRANTTKVPETSGNYSNCSSRFDGTGSPDAFIDAIVTYKSCTNMNDINALKGFPMLLTDLAATWWQGIKPRVNSWNKALDALRNAFGRTKPAFRLFMEIFSAHQEDETTEIFVCRIRALLSQLPYDLDEEVQVDMLFGLLHVRIRKSLPHDDIRTFDELLTKARSVEEAFEEDIPSKQKKVKQDDEGWREGKKRPQRRNRRRYGHKQSECSKVSAAKRYKESDTTKADGKTDNPKTEKHKLTLKNNDN